MCKCNPTVRTPFCGKPGCYHPVWNNLPKPRLVISVDKEEYDRLKRVYENIICEIETIKASIANLTNHIAIKSAYCEIQKLENLLNAKTSEYE